jgi:hypothetical protein
MRREYVTGTVILAVVAAAVTGVLADKIIEDFEHRRDGGGEWSQVVFMLLVPAAFGALTLALPGRGDEWMPFVFVAGAASVAMAYMVGREFVNGLDQNEAHKIAGRAWYGVMYFGGGMLVPLSVALGQAVRASARPHSAGR